MLGDFEKMVVHHSSTTNEWPQNTIDEKGLMVSSGRGMEKSNQDQQHPQQQQQAQQQPQSQPQQQPHLKCPRCDSSNTKFCYYNNYSLSQPRHFCKACKRYWTRGGTLRNVPVGGGCRKNKRVKRPSEASSASTAVTNPNNHVDLSSTTSGHMNPMFYGLPTNHSELNLPYPRLNSRENNAVSGFNVLGLGFSSGLMGSSHDINNDNSYRNGTFSSSNKQIHDAVTSNPIYSSYPMIHGSSTSNSSSTLASLIASSFQQQKVNNFQGLLPFENLNMAGNVDHQGGMMMKDMMKMEGNQNRFDWNGVNNQNQMQQINSSSDPSLWNTNGVGSWLDPSVPSLI